MYILLLAILSHCLIPEEFQSLANKALLNATAKVTKSLREETKLPGKYVFGDAYFTLYKTLSSSKTTEIKGYAVEDNYAAIVRRKKFNLPDGFTLIDYDKDEFYEMEKVIASDEKVSIYKAKQIDIFNVFSDICVSIYKPDASFKDGIQWDSKRNRPKLHHLGIAEAGAGAYLSASLKAKVRFKSLKKASIDVIAELVGRVGAEVILKKGSEKAIKELFSTFDIGIPGFSIQIHFLGLKFEFGLFLTFGGKLELEKDLSVNIDYFKGYEIRMQRTVSIKRHGVSDSGWKTEFNKLPSPDLVESALEDIDKNRFSAAIALNVGIKLKANVFSIIKTEFEMGLILKFAMGYGFDALACPFPYLYGRFEIPLLAYIRFSGVTLKINLFIKKKRYTLLKPKYTEIPLLSIVKTKKHCLFDSSKNSDYGVDVDAPDEDPYDPAIIEPSDRIISIELKNLNKTKDTNTLISTRLSLTEYNTTTKQQLQIFGERYSPYFDSTTNPNYDAFMLASDQNRGTSNISVGFWYNTGTNTVQYSGNEYSFMLHQYKRQDDGYVPVPITNAEGTESIKSNLRIKYCEGLALNDMYVPLYPLGVFNTSSLDFGDKYCVIVKDLDSNTTDYVDENAVFITDGAVSITINEKGIYHHNDEFFEVAFSDITLPVNPDSGTSAHYEICAEFGSNYQSRALLISNFTTNLQQGKNNNFKELKQKVQITEKMRLRVLISYIHNYSPVIFTQYITYDDIQKMAKGKRDSIIKTQSDIQVSCTCAFQRYSPIVRVNCSQRNSTHRILTNVYTLNSVKPSQNRPATIHLRDHQLYGVIQLKRFSPKIKTVIINLPNVQPLCKSNRFSDDYYQIDFDKDVIYIPFRRESTVEANLTIKHVIQGNFVDEETLYFSNLYYDINFDDKPSALILVRTIQNQFSVIGIDNTKQTLIDYGDPFFQLLALEYGTENSIAIASSLVIIDENNTLIEKTIPLIPNIKSVVFHVYCDRADEILMYDQTSNITTEKNDYRDGVLFRMTVIPGHVVDFIAVCASNASLCYVKHQLDNNGYAVFKYPNKNGITSFKNMASLFEQEDRQGLVEEVINTEKPFYYMTTASQPIKILRTYDEQIDIELRVIEVKHMYKKFCFFDHDGFIVPVSREYYANDYGYFMNEFGIDNYDEQYLDFVSGESDSCIYATYVESNDTDYDDGYNETDVNDTDYADIDMYSESTWSSKLLAEDISSRLNPSLRVCDLAKSIKVSYYKDLKTLVPPAVFDYTIYTTDKVFDEECFDNIPVLNEEINDYFLRAKQRTRPDEVKNPLYGLYFDHNDIRFNTTLAYDEFISFTNDSTIHYIDGKLNLILAKKYRTVIDVGNSEEVSINLIGKGPVEFRSNGPSRLVIHGYWNMNSTREIKVSDNIKMIEIDTVNISGNVSFTASNSKQVIDIKILHLSLLEHSHANLTGIEIGETLLIKQTATATFDPTVKISNTTLRLEMTAYQNDLIPMIRGQLIETPKEILIHKEIDGGPKLKEEYLLFDGQFDCDAWIALLNYDNSLFNNARCVSFNNVEATTLETHQYRAFTSFQKVVKVEKDYFMNGALVAIIVLAVIDVIVAVTLVIVFLKCRKQDRYADFSNSDMKTELTQNESII